MGKVRRQAGTTWVDSLKCQAKERDILWRWQRVIGL